jgi:hypothetical protein
MIEQDLIEAGFNMFRSNDQRTGLTGKFNTAIHQQAFNPLAHVKGKIARIAVHDNGITDR